MENIFYIAEIGINHNGDINITKQLIDNAKSAGFHAVKFQKRTIEKVYSKEILETLRESPWGKTTREQKEGLEFNIDQYDEIDKYCLEKKIIWFASAWDLESLEFLERYDLKYNKIASAMIVDSNFLEHVAKKRKHTFISTGMSEIKDIDNAVKIFKKHECSFELMHCVSTYPMKPEDANLKTIEALKKKYQCNVGYSGHENGIAVSLCAAMLGITSLERHITMDRAMYGSDQSASLEYQGYSQLISMIAKFRISLGEDKLGHFFEEEKSIAKKLRAHLNIL